MNIYYFSWLSGRNNTLLQKVLFVVVLNGTSHQNLWFIEGNESSLVGFSYSNFSECK